jgi:hypothetical protein
MKRWLIQTAQELIVRLLDPVTKPLMWELRRTHVPFRNRAVVNPLTAKGRRHFSQNDEDGILLEILRRLEIAASSVFLEFGVGDGTECNTIILLAMGWRGVWLDGENLAFSLPEGKTRLQFLRRWITRDNAAALAREGLEAIGVAIGDVRVASIDLDGNDGAIASALIAGGLSPDVFIVEYNGKFPPGIEFEMPYDEKHVWRGGDYCGVSLQRWVTKFSEAEYTLVACNENGINAFFVKSKHMPRFTDIPKMTEELYRIGHGYPYPQAGHPTSPETVLHLATRGFDGRNRGDFLG